MTAATVHGPRVTGATVDGPRLPVSPVVTARWVGGLFLCCVLLQRFAVTTGVSILLPIVLVWAVAAVYRGVAEIDSRRLALYVTAVVFTGLAMLAQSAWVPRASISFSSWALVLATWLPFVVRLVDRSRETYVLALGHIVRVGLGLAALCIVMMSSMLAGVRYTDLVETVFPSGLLLQGYIITYPIAWESPIYKANGWIGLEPAVVSLQLAVALVAAVLLNRTLRTVLVLAIAMVCTVAGSGIQLVVVAIVVLLALPRRNALRRCGPLLAVLVGILLTTPFGQLFLGRLTEFDSPTASTSLRFGTAYVELWGPWTVDAWTPLLGLGPGAAQRIVDGSGIPGLLTPTPAKIFVEYGIVAGLPLAAFLISCYFGGLSRTFAVALFVALWTVQASLSSTVLVSILLVLVTLWSPRSERPLDDRRAAVGTRGGHPS
jgi:hypothetical protein